MLFEFWFQVLVFSSFGILLYVVSCRIVECFEIFKFILIRLLVADATVNFNNVATEEDLNVSDKKNLCILLFLTLCSTLHGEETFPAYSFRNLAEII